MRRRNSALALCAVLAATALGVILAYTIPSAVFPAIQFDRAILLVDSGDLPVNQMLVQVTRPLEEAAYGVTGVSRVLSTTSRGSCEIDVYFTPGGNPITSFELLNSALGEARAKLPADTTIGSRLMTTSAFPILNISLNSKDRSLPELTEIAQYDLAPSLHRITGVYRVDVVGAKYREFVVQLDPAKMLAHHLTPQQVVSGLAAANVIESAGRIEDEHRMLRTVVTTALHDARQLEALPIAQDQGHPVFVRDIGTVRLDIMEDYIRTASQDGPAVLVGVSRQPNGKTVTISDQAHQILDELRARYPDVEFSISYDQAGLVSESFKSVRDAIVLGLILSVLVVFAFTISVTSAIIAAIVVPCTIAITFIVMKAAGETFNMMTLGGLAAGIGLFIDDAIVMIEAIHRAHSKGIGANEAVHDALVELTRPLIASTATVIAVFLPLAFLSGVTGVFFRALALTLGAGLAVSLILALYFTPALEIAFSRLRRAGHQPGRLYRWLQDGYLLGVRPFVHIPALALAGVVVALAVTVVFYKLIGTDYLPALDEGAFILDYLTPPESTLPESVALLQKIQHILKTTPEVVAFSRRTGTQNGFFLTESNRGDMSVRLTNKRTRGIYQIMDSVRRRILATVPGVEVDFSQELQDLLGDLSGSPQPIVVKVFGSDQATIEATACQIAARLHKISGLVDVFNGLVYSGPEEQMLVNQTQAERYGMTAADVRAALLTVVQGTVATHLRVGDRLFNVRVRYPAEFHKNLELLPEVLLATPTGGRVPLSAVTSLAPMGDRTELDRERLRPVVRVTARTEGVALGTAMARVRATINSMTLPAGVNIEYGGLYQQQQQAFHGLAMVLVAGVILMFLVLVW
ncbi:MAG: efflux RND transporter permease subunit, partial [Candidatus Binataceae bacterium]